MSNTAMDFPPAYDDPSYTKNNSQEHFPDFDPPDYYLATGGIPAAASYEDPTLEGMFNGRSSNPALLYMDFLPKLLNEPDKYTPPEFDKFPSVMNHVNYWLQGHTEYKVIRCESVERKVNKASGEVQTDETVWHQPKYGMVMFVSGLRLWLRMRNDNEKPVPQQIGYVNVVPRNRPMRLPIYAHAHVGPMVSTHMGVGFYEVPDFENLDKTVEKFNKTLDDTPLPGSVLTIESLDWKYSEIWHDKCLDPDKSYWVEENKSWKLYVAFLRVFFEIGTPTGQKIGIQDFIPKITRIPSKIGLPSYEPYDNVLSRAQKWLLQDGSMGIKVTNIQTIHAKVKERHHMMGINTTMMGHQQGIGQSDERTFQVLTNQTQFAEDTKTQFVKVVRVTYVTPADVSEPLYLTSRIFAPVRLSNRQAESTSQTVQRINAWIHAAGASVIGVDSLQFEFNPNSKQVRMDETSYVVQQSQGHYWMTAIRLYIHGEFQEPPSEVLPPVPDYAAHTGSSSCCSVL